MRDKQKIAYKSHWKKFYSVIFQMIVLQLWVYMLHV